jgi:proton-translocating NADH-quinone oxidoreductase chain N
MTFLSVLLPFLPEVVLLAGALLAFVLDVVGVRRLEAVGGIAVVSTLLALLLVLADLRWAPIAGLATIPASSVDVPAGQQSLTALFAFSSLGLVFQAIFLLSAFFVSLASLSRPSNEKGASIFFGLLLIATLGMLLAAVSEDLIFLLLAIEVVGISTYLLVGYTRKDSRGIEAAMKFYIVGALSTALSFFGASLLFGAYAGSGPVGSDPLNFLVLNQSVGSVGFPALALVGYAFLIAGVGFKVTAVPFHAWAVDVYDGAPTDATAFLAGGSKKVGVFAFFLIFLGPITLHSALAPTSAFNYTPDIQLGLVVLSIATMTLGNVLALLQKEMKRMLAYSSISQAGYMLIGIAIGTSAALTGATFQVFAHVFMKVGAFLVVAAVAGLGIGPLIDDWRGLGTRRPYLSIAFALMLLSLAGIPLTVGFFSKFILFSAAVQAQGLFVWLAVAGVLNSALSVFYYGRVLKVMFMDASPVPAPEETVPATSALAFGIGWGRSAAIALAVVAIVALGIDPQPVLQGIQTAAAHFVVTGA